MGDEDVDIRVQLKGVARFSADSKRAARSIDDIGDKAQRAARQLRQLNKTTSTARLSLGPLSIKAKTGALAIGAFALGIQKATPALLGFAEATATVVAGTGAAGAVGLTALAQGFGVASLASKDLTDALGGNAAAIKRLDPAMRGLFDTLKQKQDTLRQSAIGGLLPGLARGAKGALRNFGVVNRITKRTGSALGGIASNAGGLFGSKAFGRDLGRAGNTNVRIIKNLGAAALSLASAARHVIVEAGPLAEWLSELAARGSKLLDNWLAQKRAGGDLRRFFQDTKRDLQVLGSIMGHTGRGIINLFGADDVDGTKTLRSLDRLSAGFERWTRTVKRGHLGEAIADQIPKAGGLIASAMANTLGAAVPVAARLFWETFWNSDAAGKALIGSVLLKKTGVFALLAGALGKSSKLGKGGGIGGAIFSSKPVPVFVTNPGFGGGGLPGGGKGKGGGGGLAKRVLPKLAAGSVGGPEGLAAAAAAATLAEVNHFGQSHGIDPPAAARHAPRGRNQVFHIEIPVKINDREIARAGGRFTLQEIARNARWVDHALRGGAAGAGH